MLTKIPLPFKPGIYVGWYELNLPSHNSFRSLALVPSQLNYLMPRVFAVQSSIHICQACVAYLLFGCANG